MGVNKQGIQRHEMTWVSCGHPRSKRATVLCPEDTACWHFMGQIMIQRVREPYLTWDKQTPKVHLPLHKHQLNYSCLFKMSSMQTSKEGKSGLKRNYDQRSVGKGLVVSFQLVFPITYLDLYSILAGGGPYCKIQCYSKFSYIKASS